MSEPTRKRLIEFPERAWAALDADARRSRRSSMKQLQVLIENVYGLQDTDGTDPGRTARSGRRGAREGPVEVDQDYLFSTGDAGSSKQSTGKEKQDFKDVQKDARDRANKRRQTPDS